MNLRKMLLAGVLAIGLVASVAPTAEARDCRCDSYDDRYYDAYDPDDRYGSYDDRSYDDPYYGRNASSDPFDYDGDGKFKFKRDWPSLLGLFLNTQASGQLGQFGQFGQFIR